MKDKFIKNKVYYICVFLLIFILFLIPNIRSFYKVGVLNNNQNWEKYLYTPTQINYYDGNYFIVDCWNHRIIYNDNLKSPVGEWRTLTDKILGGHTIASDGNVLISDDTDNDYIRVFKKSKNSYTETQIINIDDYLPDNISYYNESQQIVRPHFVLYNEELQLFYVALSWGGSIAVLKNTDGVIDVQNVYKIKELEGKYVKFINLIDGKLYCGMDTSMLELELSSTDIKVSKIYNSNFSCTLNFMTKINDYYYFTYWAEKGIMRAKSLDDFMSGNYENLSDTFNTITGIPYYISLINGKYYITEIVNKQGILSFSVDKDNSITDIEETYSFSLLSPENEARKNIDPILQ